VRLGKRTDHREVPVRDLVPLVQPDRLVFGGWDIFPDDVYAAARKAGVLERELLDQLRPELEAIAPMKAVFEKRFVRNLDGTHVKPEKGHRARIEALRADIREFRKAHKLLVGTDPALSHHGNRVRNQLAQTQGILEIHRKGIEVAVVDPDQGGLHAHCNVQVLLSFAHLCLDSWARFLCDRALFIETIARAIRFVQALSRFGVSRCVMHKSS